MECFVEEQCIRYKKAYDQLMIFFYIRLSGLLSAFKEMWFFFSISMCCSICLYIGFCKCTEILQNMGHLAEWIFFFLLAFTKTSRKRLRRISWCVWIDVETFE